MSKKERAKERSSKAQRSRPKFPVLLTAFTFVATSLLGLVIWQGTRTANHTHIPIVLIFLLLAVVAWDVWQIVDWWRG